MKIDFYGDLTCPWCYLGWRRLHAACAQRPQSEISIFWRPFQLNPDLPATGLPRQEYLLRKFGNAERVREVLHAVELALRSDGIHANLHRIKITSNTYLAHRLSLLAQDFGCFNRLFEALFVAYFVEGQDLGDPVVLRQICRSLPLPAEKVEAELASPLPHPGIVSSELQARQLNIRAVPYFVFDERYSLAGAHDPVAYLPLLDLAIVPANAGCG